MKDEAVEAAAQAPPAFVVGPRGRELLLPPLSSNYEAWDLSDSESAPVSSWATLPNRALLCQYISSAPVCIGCKYNTSMAWRKYKDQLPPKGRMTN
ncbi:uncharacterized protein [Miscanthus floridulus]|uniref:uncharacterized protein n=1 Tax=Miscanthus floridulus TaxID=154761 RepID=UPI003459FD5D